MRIGNGYDVHRLCDNRRLILGGVEIPFEKGLSGHSDADVLVHAIMDALLGACALGDIGKHFPDNDEDYKNADSIELLKKVTAIIEKQGFFIENIDSIIIAQRPKLSPYIDKMRERIAAACKISVGLVSVKATTEE
ncbi:MAG: 2-C-methyl-D-erythritol 2,4-cyclodiphosphate synthase, partial [Oscillospiraceae bacterium]